MRTVDIVAESSAAARSLLDALAGLEVGLVQVSAGDSEVGITVGGSDDQIIAVLSALETYLSGGRQGTRVCLREQRYANPSAGVPA